MINNVFGYFFFVSFVIRFLSFVKFWVKYILLFVEVSVKRLNNWVFGLIFSDIIFMFFFLRG